MVPQGVTGELYVSGICLAEGYLNRQELTDTKFINNPFEQGTFSRMYRTGDLARWLPDGNIEFLGRTDDQVKVRGFRVEPGEIETAIQQHPAVDAVVVLALPGKQGGKELVAYIAAHQQLTVTDMRNYLGQLLPAYMIPSFFVQLDSLPYNTNGKINKKMLPDPLVAGLSAGNEYEAPRNETEEKLARIWKTLLGKDRIGVKDNFFELGGHSLQATQLIARIKKEFSVRINIQTLFNEPTIENISDHILFLLDQEQRMRNSEQLMEIDLL
jgi:acyl carrier protein